MAVARVDGLSFTYPGAARPALADVSLEFGAGEVVLVLGPSGSGKSTLLRALGGLVPHFHGGTFAGRVELRGADTRRHRPPELAGAIAYVFQDPEEQLVRERVDGEVAFGLENTGAPANAIRARTDAALEALGVAHLAGRRVHDLSGGELQRVCLAAALALAPTLLVLDEPTSQLDPDAARELLDLATRHAHDHGLAVVLSEQRPANALEHADRVLFVDRGRVVCDAPVEDAVAWLERHRPAYVATPESPSGSPSRGHVVCSLVAASYAYGDVPAVDGFDLELRSGEIVALLGPNGSGKTTIAKLCAGLLEPQRGTMTRRGRATMLLQDAGRHSVRDRAEDEVALAIGGDRRRARAALASVGLGGAAERHPHDLSSGERERLALAAVLAPEPDLLVLDEPTKGADPERKQALAAFLRAQAHERATLVVTHDLGFAHAVADRHIALGAATELVHA